MLCWRALTGTCMMSIRTLYELEAKEREANDDAEARRYRCRCRIGRV